MNDKLAGDRTRTVQVVQPGQSSAGPSGVGLTVKKSSSASVPTSISTSTYLNRGGGGSGPSTTRKLGTGRGSTTTKRAVSANAAFQVDSAIHAASVRERPTTTSHHSSRSHSSTSTSETKPRVEPQKHQQSWDPPPSPTVMHSMTTDGGDDADFVHWQSSQTTNPALRSLLKEASSESFDVNLLPSSSSTSTRVSPHRQHAQLKSSSSSNTNADFIPISSSATHPTLQSTTRLRPRNSTSSVPEQQQQQQHHHPEPDSPFTTGDPSRILEMMRGVSAMIDESTRSASTPLATRARARTAKKIVTKVLPPAGEGIGKSGSSMDVIIGDDGQSPSVAAESRKKKTKGDISMGDLRAPVNVIYGGQEKRKGKVGERDVSMMVVDEDAGADADVSIRDVSMMDVSMADIPTDVASASTRRTEMLPPPFKLPKPSFCGARSGASSAEDLCVKDRVKSREGRDEEATMKKHPEVKLHPLLVEKQRSKELKRSQTVSNPPSALSDNTHINTSVNTPNTIHTPARAPITRSASVTNTSSASPAFPISPAVPSSQSSTPPALSQSRHPPRLGMCRSRTAPLPASFGAPLANSPSSANMIAGNENVVAVVQNKKLVKPFRPPTRVPPPPGVAYQASQFSQQHSSTFVGYDPNQAYNNANNSRTAYPSPSPGSDDGGGKKESESLKEPAYVKPSQGGWRDRECSPVAFLPPTPESLTKGASDPEEETRCEETEMREDASDSLEATDLDSSFGDVTFDFNMDALEETMRKYD